MSVRLVIARLFSSLHRIRVDRGISILRQAGLLVSVPLFGPLCKAVKMVVILLNILRIKA